MKIILKIIIILMPLVMQSQSTIKGMAMIKNSEGKTEGLPGATIYWLGTDIGTTTNDKGWFTLNYKPEYKKLVFSFVGYRTDTVTVNGPKEIHHFMVEEGNLDEVVIEAEKQNTAVSYLQSANIVTINEGELLKAACCNLSESFETNPSIDVNFSDALTGTKQIRMLGLTSPYILIAQENIPSVRGASQAYGLTFTPGTWIESIQITKGSGSVTNGYESIAGQINTELRKPLGDDKLFVNAYGSLDGRLELNTHFSQKVSDKWNTSLFVHGNLRDKEMDRNDDNFLDIPLAKQINVMNRWQYTDAANGFVSFINFRYMKDDKQTGEVDFDPNIHKLTTQKYGSEINTERFDASVKLGYVFPETPYNSMGFQLAYSGHQQDSYFGLNQYDINHKSVYSNLLFNSILGSTLHKYKTGISFTYDSYDEFVNTADFGRSENSFGGFFEYSYDNLDDFSLIAGLRLDFHNLLGTFITPRLHVRYAPWEKGVLRASVGRGKRSANIFAENQQLFGSSRVMNILNTDGKIYGLSPEIAWNYGFSFLQGFNLFDRKADFTIDYYSTQFQNQAVVDVDESPQQVLFYNLEGNSHANNLQVQFNYELAKKLDLRVAYKNYDVKTDYQKGTLEKPLQSKHIFFANMGYETNQNAKGAHWRFDYTFNWLGKQRLPFTGSNPTQYQLDEYSPSYSLMNAQIAKVFSKNFEIYVGGENLANYKQENPILASDNPFGTYFDSSIVYAPINGSMYYAGLRYTLN
ncbi:TonB-dependent receptor [Aureibaculum sp. 2210JD6-5]|uniref:TonB-dependent receptor n=1 Tax=Aureibaculum sp. 2210JD6-5 TaxID=3103957 RepID=UPI002AAECC2B|nr:TonB-dependent receptor [Aureibaculum sp. 2210JD6-5]MDY7395330.1 TonB-dependent receptor [Aureibaculum sp. 2210JD6-5]